MEGVAYVIFISRVFCCNHLFNEGFLPVASDANSLNVGFRFLVAARTSPEETRRGCKILSRFIRNRCFCRNVQVVGLMIVDQLTQWELNK